MPENGVICHLKKIKVKRVQMSHILVINQLSFFLALFFFLPARCTSELRLFKITGLDAQQVSKPASKRGIAATGLSDADDGLLPRSIYYCLAYLVALNCACSI